MQVVIMAMVGFDHRHLKKQATYWPGLPPFVDSSSYVGIKHTLALYAGCIDLPPDSGSWLDHQLLPMNSLFVLDDYDFDRVHKILTCKYSRLSVTETPEKVLYLNT